MAVPAGLAARAAHVDAHLLEDVAPAVEQVRALHPRLAPWADELTGMLAAGGKRLRPALLLLGVGIDGDDATALPAAHAVELLHTCALLHDDLIDGADTRRGRTTAHVSFAARHRAEGMAGDADRYGTAAAVLIGDLAFAVADRLFLSTDVDDTTLRTAFLAFTVLREEVMAGQALDVEAAAARLTSREVALAIASAKSGRYSVARPLEIGALLGGTDPSVASALATAVEPLGQAFQVRDDLLGVFGDDELTGKPAADDLREGKRTLVVVEALDRLDPASRERLERLLGDPELDDAGVAIARDLIRTSGALAAVDAWTDEAIRRGMAAVDDLPLPVGVRDELGEIGRWLVGREA